MTLPVHSPSFWIFVGLVTAWAVTLMVQARRLLPYWVARKRFSEGDYDGALRRIEWLERLHLTTPSFFHFKGTILMFAGRNQESQQALEQCLAHQQHPVRRSLTLVNLGYVLLGQRCFDEAREAFETAIQLRPDGAVAYSSLAEVYLQQGIEPRKALDLVERGIHYKQGSDAQARVDRHIFGYLFANRAWALFLLERPAEAEKALDEARKFTGVESKPGSAGVHYHIARALLAGGLDTAAREHFRQAREIDPRGRYAALAEAASRDD